MKNNNKTIEDLIKEIKKVSSYKVYESMVKDGKEDTYIFLQMTTMLDSLANKELGQLMTSVAMDIMFAIADQKLRAEILESEE